MRALRAGRHVRGAVLRFARASASERLFTWLGLHITKLHIYGSFAGTLSIIDWAEGHMLYSCGVWGLALLDMSRDLRG